MYRKSKDGLLLIGKLLKTGGKLPPTQWVGVKLLTASSALLFSSTVLAANSEPAYQQGSANPTTVTQGNSVQLSSSWSDAENNYIVDVDVRYGLQGTGQWQGLRLNYVAGSDPPSFSNNTIRPEVPGTYEYQFRASDAAPTASGTRLHTTVWQGGGTFTVVKPEIPKTSSVYTLQRSAIGQQLGNEVKWVVKDGEKPLDKKTEVTLCIWNLNSGENSPSKSAVVVDNSELIRIAVNDSNGWFKKVNFFDKEAIYAVAAVRPGTACDESVKNQAVVQIVGPTPTTTEKIPFPTNKICNPTETYEVLVIDGTSAGIGAAYTAAKEGLKTCLLESTSLVGGMLTNGIGHTDISFYQFVNGKARSYLSYGLMDELRQMVEKKLGVDKTKSPEDYCKSGTGDDVKKFLLCKTYARFGNAISGLDYTPSVIRQAMYELLGTQSNLFITLDAPFDSITGGKEEGYTVVTSKGSPYKGKYLVDATDSGDVAVALSKPKDEKSSYCDDALNNRNFGGQVTQDDVPTNIPVKQIPTFCLRSPTQAYSFVMTLQEHSSDENWSLMNTPPPNCFGKKGPKGQVVGIEGQYTDDFFTDENNHWSVDSGLMGVNPVIFQVKHHATTDNYEPATYRTKNLKGFSIDDGKKTCRVDKAGVNGGVVDYNYASGKSYKSLGDELIDCNAHGVVVVGLPTTGYAAQTNDTGRLPIVDRYLNHTMCFLYNMQHLDKKTPITDLVWLKKLELEWFKEQLKSKDAKKPPTLLAAEALTNSNSSTIGLAKEEDSTRGNFPARMYVREGRRINGLQTFTGKDAQNAYYDGKLMADKEEIDKAKPDKEVKALKAFNEAKVAVDKAVASNKTTNLVKTASKAIETASKAVGEALRTFTISPDGLTYLKSHYINEKGRPYTEEQLQEEKYSGDQQLENPKEKLKRSIAITTYGMDSHSIYLDESGDGNIPPSQMNLITGSGAVPFGVMVPRSLATENILVPLAASAGTWGQSVMRMEPTRLSMGQAAAVAIRIAKDRGINFQQFTDNEGAIFALQKRLISEYGEKIYLYLDDGFYPENAEKHKDPEHMAAQFLGVWGIASGYGLDNGTPYLFGKESKPKKEECKTMVDNANNQLFAGIPTIGELCSSTRGKTALELYNAIVDTKGWEFFVKTDKQQPGKMQIISDSFRNTNLTTVKVDGNSVTITKEKESDNIISFNTGATRENLKRPQTIVVNSNGKVFTTYYPFGDVPLGQPYTNAILQLWKANIVEGQNGMFEGDRNVKRSEFLKMALLATKPGTAFPQTTTSFQDVPKDYWASGYINYAQTNRIAEGSNSKFRPEDSIIRAETAKMIAKASSPLSSLASQISQKVFGNTCPTNLTDLEANAWYCPFVAVVSSQQVMKGQDNKFRPNDNLSRIEAAFVACRALNPNNIGLCQ